MSRDTILITSLYELFVDRPIKNCLDSNNAVQLVVYEDVNGRACIETVEHPSSIIGFLVQNPSKKRIYLLALDHCFFEDHEDTRCDCIIFDDHYFCFVELKLNVRPRRATQELKSARRQLGVTIQFFKATLLPKSKNFFNFTLEAYVVMQTPVYPRKRAGRDIVFVKFLEDFGVELYERNSKSF
jgi:hypothetical protein